MTRPDLLPVGRPGFGTDATDDADPRGNWHAYACIVVALLVLTLGVLGFLWWIDRVAEPPSFRPTIQPRASWLDGPVRTERDIAAKLEERDEEGRP